MFKPGKPTLVAQFVKESVLFVVWITHR